MRLRSRLALFVALPIALTLASSIVPRTRVEVQDWDCPPAPASCARPVVARGFPMTYVSDFHGISVTGDASLVSALLGDEIVRGWSFVVDVAFYAVLVWLVHAFAIRRRSST